MKKTSFEIGERVWWSDPDNDISSGEYEVIKKINSEVYLISNGTSEVEVPYWEIERR